MVQKYLVDLRDKTGVCGFGNFVDGFGHENRRWSKCLVIHCEYFGATDGLTVDCKVT